MATKIIRGQKVTFIAEPKDYLDQPVTPASLKLYVRYVHMGDTEATPDPAINMDPQTDGTWIAEFDTSGATNGPLFVSMQAEGPSAADDDKLSIVANAANLDAP